MRALHLALSLLAGAAASAPAVAHAGPLEDYTNRNGRAVCAELDKADSGGDIFRLALTISKQGGFSLREAGNVIGRSTAAYCPHNAAKVKQAGYY
jgi:Protein of unknown function (DUF732)